MADTGNHASHLYWRACKSGPRAQPLPATGLWRIQYHFGTLLSLACNGCLHLRFKLEASFAGRLTLPPSDKHPVCLCHCKPPYITKWDRN